MLYKWYENKIQSRFIKPQALEKRMRQLFVVAPTLDPVIKAEVSFAIRAKIRRISMEKNLKVKRAPVVELSKLFALASRLWNTKFKNSIKAFKCKAGATILTFCVVSGARWINATRLFWEDLIVQYNGDKIFLAWPLRLSKANDMNLQDDYRVIANTKGNCCSVTKMINWWVYQGCRTSGPVFPDPMNWHRPINVRT